MEIRILQLRVEKKTNIRDFLRAVPILGSHFIHLANDKMDCGPDIKHKAGFLFFYKPSLVYCCVCVVYDCKGKQASIQLADSQNPLVIYSVSEGGRRLLFSSAEFLGQETCPDWE